MTTENANSRYDAATAAETYLKGWNEIVKGPEDPIMYLLWCYTPASMQCGNFANHVLEAKFKQTRSEFIDGFGQSVIEEWARQMDDGVKRLFANPTPEIEDLTREVHGMFNGMSKTEQAELRASPPISIVDAFWKIGAELIIGNWCDKLVEQMGEATKTAHLGVLIDTLDVLAGMRAYLKSIGKLEFLPIVDDAITTGKRYEDAVTEFAQTLRKRLLARMPYAEYLCTPDWIERRNRKLKQANHRCELCNSTASLQVHHKTYARRGDELDSDLIVLCDVCHAKHHGKLPKETAA